MPRPWPAWPAGWSPPKAIRFRRCSTSCWWPSVSIPPPCSGASPITTARPRPRAGTWLRPSGWSTVVQAGDQPPRAPAEATLVLPLTGVELLALRGPGLTAEDREILAAFAAQLATALESDRLHAEAAEADSLARANQLRSALLAAVSHDLRTPLASIKAASSSLLSDQLEFGPDETRILLQTVDDEADRLNSLVENLLDMSRLQTGSMDVLHQSTDIVELIDAAVDSLGPRGDQVAVDVERAPPPHPHRPGAPRAGAGQPHRQCPRPRRRERAPDRGRSGGRPGGHPGHRPRPGDPARGP